MNRLIVTFLVAALTVQQVAFAADVDLDRLRDYLQRRALLRNQEAPAADSAIKRAILEAPNEPETYQFDPQQFQNAEQIQQAQRQLENDQDPQGLGIYQYNYDPDEPIVNPEMSAGFPGRQLENEEEQPYYAPQAFQDDSGPIIDEERTFDEPSAAEQRRGFVGEPQSIDERNYEQRAAYDGLRQERVLQGPALSSDELMQRERAEREQMERAERLAETQRMMMEEEAYAAAEQRALAAAAEGQQRSVEDDQMLEAYELKGVNEQMQDDVAEIVATRSGGRRQRPRNNTRWEEFKNQKVIKATKVERDSEWNDFKSYGVIVTVETSNKRHFIRGRSYGNVQVVRAERLSEQWEEKDSKTIRRSTVDTFLKAAGIGRDSYEAVTMMWKLE